MVWAMDLFLVGQHDSASSLYLSFKLSFLYCCRVAVSRPIVLERLSE